MCFEFVPNVCIILNVFLYIPMNVLCKPLYHLQTLQIFIQIPSPFINLATVHWLGTTA